MATIRLRFVAESDLVSALIREKTFSEFSHVEFLLEDGATLGAHFSGGVAIRPADYAKYTRVAVFEVQVAEAEKQAVMAFARAQLGKKYDTGAIVGMCLDRDWRDADRWFCSELVAAAFEPVAPLLRIADDVDRITPRDLLLSLMLTPVRCGEAR